MDKEKLAIVSSYNDLCGNASYTKALCDSLSKHYIVTVIPLNVDLLRKGDSKLVWNHVKAICKQLETFDCVNIQFEAGLFGSNLSSMMKNFFAIAKASKRLVLTMHRVHGKEIYPGIIFLGKTFLTARFGEYLKAWQQAYGHNRWANLYKKVLKFCIHRNVPIIVHTPRDREFIKERFNYDKVFDHPLCFYDQEQIESIAKTYTRTNFCENLSLDKDKKYIGIFGFINKYKGHETAIKALKHLPENYELLIFGAQHPHTIKPNEQINEYIDSLLRLIDKLELSERVKFYRKSRDEDFLKALLHCDFNVVPYLEVNQGGSAIAALSLETNSNVIFSQNCAFFELAKYAPDAFKMFSIGNHLELANAIKSYRKEEYAAPLSEYHKKYNVHTSAELYKSLLFGNSLSRLS